VRRTHQQLVGNRYVQLRQWGRGRNSVVPLNQTAFVPPFDLHHSRAQIVYIRAQEKGEERGMH